MAGGNHSITFYDFYANSLGKVTGNREETTKVELISVGIDKFQVGDMHFDDKCRQADGKPTTSVRKFRTSTVSELNLESIYGRRIVLERKVVYGRGN